MENIPPNPPDVAQLEGDPGKFEDPVEHDSDSDTYRVSFDSEGNSVSMAVISTIAVISETDPLELPPLCSAVDPDAIEALIEPTGTRPANEGVHVSFTFDGYSVTVHSYGIISVNPPEEQRDSSARE